MGTDCAPFLANLFLYSYEHDWMMEKKKTDMPLAKRFSRSTRYIDDLLTINNDGLMLQYMSEIYPAELELKHENSKNDQQASYLDLNIQIVNNELVTSLYDKRDDFPFKIVNFPDLSGNIPHASSLEYSLLNHYDTRRHVTNTMISWIVLVCSKLNSYVNILSRKK